MARRGRSNATVRIDQDLWEEFDVAVKSVGGGDRSAVIRSFIAWYVRRTGSPPPRRPPPPSQQPQ